MPACQECIYKWQWSCKTGLSHVRKLYIEALIIVEVSELDTKICPWERLKEFDFLHRLRGC